MHSVNDTFHFTGQSRDLLLCSIYERRILRSISSHIYEPFVNLEALYFDLPKEQNSKMQNNKSKLPKKNSKMQNEP